ncbi:MAG: signal peptide peptidase SppA [Bdellovibrionales bacterium]|nr:signal peptide peptidase SppA [Bdellovibrionales bacterium]
MEDRPVYSPPGSPPPLVPKRPTEEPPRARRRRINPLFWILGASGFLFLVFVFLSGKLILDNQGRGGGGPAKMLTGKKKVGVIEISGVIMESKKVLKNLEKFSEDQTIKAVVLRLNSPGGAVAPSQEIYEAVKKFSKPLVVSMSSVAASGAYYIAAGSKKVFANPGTITGSIGVIMQFTNMEKLYEWAKISRYSIKTGKFKDAGADYRSMTPEERALLQGLIDDTLQQFRTAVGEGRKLTAAELDGVADGRIFSGAQAKALKLVDELGTLQDAIDEAAKLGAIDGKPKVVYPDRVRQGIIDWLTSPDSDDSESSSASGAPTQSALTQLISNLLSIPTPPVRLQPGVYWLLPWGV